MERDGRPQGPTHPHPHRPRPYYTPIPVAPCIVGAEPIRAYLNGIDHKGPPPASSPRFTCPPDRVPLRYGESARTVRVSLSANLLKRANIYILFIVRSATIMRR